MKNTKNVGSTKNIIFLNVAIVLGLLLSLGMIYNFQAENKKFIKYWQRVSVLPQDIRYYDEVLTMSARMTAFTKQLHWIDRYNDAVAPLDESIATAKKLVPGIEKNLKKIQTANNKLIAIEEKAFALCKDGEFKEAQEELLSHEYETFKHVYSNGLHEVIALIRQNSFEKRDEAEQKFLILLSIIVTALIGTTILGFYLFRIFSNQTEKLKDEVDRKTADITASAQRMKTLFDAAPDAITLIHDNKWKDCNPATLKLFGTKTKADFLNHLPSDISPEFQPDGISSRDKVYEAIGKAMQNGSHQMEWTHIRLNDGTPFICEITLAPMLLDGEPHVYGIIRDITARKELEQKVEDQRTFLNTLLDSQEQIILTTNGEKITSVNNTFLDFFAVDTIQEFNEEYDASCICDTFNTDAPDDYLQIEVEDKKWIDYILSGSNSNKIYKAMISRGNTDFIFSVTAAKLPGDDGLKSAVFTNITDMEKAKQELEAVHKHTRESIEYASLIQNSLIPDNKTFKHFFEDYFAIWEPKDIVGGDIYLMEQVSEDEVILMVIDCTGHGVPGAFVTMLVKAVERQLMANIHKDEVISPAKILQIFNKSIKHLLKQESEDSISNAGFDGGIIYYNKKTHMLKFAGAETSLFYIDNNELKTIKGNRHSVGYKKSDANYEFTDHTVEVREGMKFYCATDGFLDQNGGEKGFPFSKKRFSNLIKENYKKTFSQQKEILFNSLANYQGDEDRNDDVTVIGFKI